MPPGAKRVTFCFPSRALRNGRFGIATDTEPTGAPDAAEVKNVLLGGFGAGAAAVKSLQLEETGGCHVTFRAAVVKLAGLKLVGVGVACALVAAAGISTSDTRSCALSAAICFVAAYFYTRIWQIRGQLWEGGAFELATLLPKNAVADSDATTKQKLHAQEQAVDGFRCFERIRTNALGCADTLLCVRVRAQAN